MAAAAISPTRRTSCSPSSSDGSMRAIVQRRYGSADTLSAGEVARPAIGPADVLVEVRAAGLDRGTWHLMAGLPYAVRLMGFGVRAPKNPVPGFDVAGIVAAVGADVTRFAAGDEVFGIGRGSFAEFTAAREDKLALKPAELSFEQAAALPISGLTALRGLTDAGRLQAGQRVLVIGASGGVGTHAVQIAKALGAEVTGVASTSKLDLVRSIGADHVVDYTCEDFAAGAPAYDLILDLGGNSSLSRLRRALAPAGTLVIGGGEEGGRWLGGVDRQLRALALSRVVGQRLTTFVNKEHFSGLERLARLVDDGGLVPVVERTFALSEMPDAMRHLASGRARGKLVIRP
jgi:NADPH:quinone reductase-like Zn-dependent oxidoreductase